MKKITGKIVAATFIAATLFTSAKAHAQALEKKQNTIGVAVGLGTYLSYNSALGSRSFLPSLSVSYDRGIVDQVGPGNISAGAYLEFKSDSYTGAGYKVTYSNTFIAVRAAYHPTFYRIEKLDYYAGANLGFRIESYSDNFGGKASTGSSPLLNPFVGARYDFSSNFGAYAELGYGLSILRAGIAYKF